MTENGTNDPVVRGRGAHHREDTPTTLARIGAGLHRHDEHLASQAAAGARLLPRHTGAVQALRTEITLRASLPAELTTSEDHARTIHARTTQATAARTAARTRHIPDPPAPHLDHGHRGPSLGR